MASTESEDNFTASQEENPELLMSDDAENTELNTCQQIVQNQQSLHSNFRMYELEFHLSYICMISSKYFNTIYIIIIM